MERRRRAASGRIYWAIGALIGVVAALVVLLAAFPWGIFGPAIQRSASERLGRPVSIGKIERADAFSFSPTLRIRDLQVPAAPGMGNEPLVHVDTAMLRFSAWSLLWGRFRPLAIEASGVRMSLVRDAQGKVNWQKPGGGSSGASGQLGGLDGLTLRDTIVRYRDDKHQRAFLVSLASDPASGLRITGTGSVRGTPVKVSAQGPSIAQGQGRAWPFTALLDGPALRFAVKGVMDRPLDTGHMTIDVESRADDLKLIDAVIEAGLFGTQLVRVTAHARHDGPDWNVSRVAGTIGQSDLSGSITVHKADGRTKLAGNFVSNGLRFDDLASNAGHAQSAAKLRSEGPKLIPDTRINLVKIPHTDGTIDLTVYRLIDAGAIRSLRGRITLDHQLMTLDPFVAGLTRGTLTGTMRVDQRGGVPVPQVTIDLKLADTDIAALSGEGDVTGHVEGRAHVTGRGSTIREVVGNGSGRIGVIARDGSLPRKLATMMGFDAGGTLLAKDDQRSGLRCMALRLVLHDGLGTADPLLVDTSRSQMRGTGTIRFPEERIAFSFTGAPKSGGLIRLPGHVSAAGTIRDPQIVIPEGTKSLGNILKGLGRAIDGGQRDAGDANCPALEATVLG